MDTQAAQSLHEIVTRLGMNLNDRQKEMLVLNEVARAFHASDKARLLALGFKDHPFQGEQENWPCDYPGCRAGDYVHTNIMQDFDKLPASEQTTYGLKASSFILAISQSQHLRLEYVP